MITPQALLFDLDGTLIDSREMILTSFQYATQTVLDRTIPDNELLELVGIPLAQQMKVIDEAHASELIAVYREHNERVHDELLHAFPDVKGALEQLKGTGLPMVVVTSKRNELAWRGLRCLGLEDYFDFLIGSNDTQKHKPEPEPLILAAQRLGVNIEYCVYVGDSPYDMQAATAAGALAVAATWGMFATERLWAAGAQYAIDSLAELPDLLHKL